MAKLLTLQQIADQLDIPPATVKYYRDHFQEFMPAVNVGRYPKYSAEALDIIRDIRELFQEGLSRDQVKEELAHKHAVNQENLTTTTTATTAQQPPELLNLLQNNSLLLQEQQQTIKKQAAIIEHLTQQIGRLQQEKDRLYLQESETKNKPGRSWIASLFKKGKH